MDLYLEGYRAAYRVISYDLTVHGWARAKGFLKKQIANTLKYDETAHVPRLWTAGWLDGLMDSVN